MVDFLIYRSCNITDLGVSATIRRQDDIVERGLSLVRDPSGVPPDDNDGSDNPTIDVQDASWGAPVDGDGKLPPGTYDYDIIPVDTCTGRTGKPIALPSLTIDGNSAVGSIIPASDSNITDGDSFTLNDGVNAPVQFVFDKQSRFATGEINAVNAAQITDGDYFILSDGVSSPIRFEFDKNSSIVDSAILKGIPLSGFETSSIVALAVQDKINASGLGVTASVSASGNVVSVTNDVVGVVGNVTITIFTNFAAPIPRVTVSGMSGGSGVVPATGIVPIPLIGGESISDVGSLIQAAIQGSGIGIDATGINPMSLKNTVSGASGNQPITQSGSSPLAVAGMAGGAGTGQVANLRVRIGSIPTKCDAAQLRRNGVIVGPVFPLEDVPSDTTTITQLDPIGSYDIVGNTDDADDPNKAKGSNSFRRTGGADLVGGDVVLYNGVAVKVTKVIGSSIPQTIEFEPPIPSSFKAPDKFFDASNRSGFYEGFSTAFSALGNIPAFGSVLSPAQYAPMWPPLSGIYWPGPIMSFKTVPNHVLVPLPLPFFNDIQEGDIIAYGSKTALVVYVERSIFSVPPLVPTPGDPAPGPGAGTVLVLPFGILPIPPLPAGQFWIIHRSLQAPDFGFYYSAYNKPTYSATTPPAPDDGVDPTAALPLFGGFADFADVGPTLIRAGIAADGGSGSGYAQGQLNVDATGLSRALPLDGEHLIITDGTSAVTFEFDADDSVVETATLRSVPLPVIDSPVTGIDLLNNTVLVSADLTTKLSAGDTIYLVGSTGNDGTYTVASLSFVTSTTLVLNEPLVDVTIDGNVRYIKGKASDIVSALKTAINSTPSFGVTANVYAAPQVVELRNTVAPSTGATAIISTVTGTDFVTTGMAVGTVNFDEFLPKDAFVADSPSSPHHRLNAFRVLGNGKGGMGPPDALKAGQMILIDGSVVTVNEVTELIPPDGFEGTALPGFPGTYEVHFTNDLVDSLGLFSFIPGTSRPISPVGPWVTIPSFTSPFLKKPDIDAAGSYERISRRVEIKQELNTWQWEEDGSNLDRSGFVDGTESKAELNKIMTQNGYEPGVDGLLALVRGDRSNTVSDVFVSTNGDFTQLGDRLIAVNDMASTGNGSVVDLNVLRALHDESCSSFETLRSINDALKSDPVIVMRVGTVDVLVPGPSCPPGQNDTIATELVCLGIATPNSPVSANETARVFWSPEGRSVIGVKKTLEDLGLSSDEASDAINLLETGRVLTTNTVSPTVAADIDDLSSIAKDSDVDNVLLELRIDLLNTGRIVREHVQSFLRRTGVAGIIGRPIGTDWAALAKDKTASLVSDYALPVMNLASKAFVLQGSFDICDYQAAIDSITDKDMRDRISAFFAIVENTTNRMKDVGKVLVETFYGDKPFTEAQDTLSGILSGTSTDPSLSCLAGPITATGEGSLGIAPRGKLGRLDSMVGDFSENFITRFRLSSLLGSVVSSILCQVNTALTDLIGTFGGETAQSSLSRGISCLPSQERLLSLGIEFPSVEVEVALLCSNDLLSVYGDIITAFISEMNESINLGNSMGSGFVAEVAEASNRMCSSDPSLAKLAQGLRATLGVG